MIKIKVVIGGREKLITINKFPFVIGGSVRSDLFVIGLPPEYAIIDKKGEALVLKASGHGISVGDIKDVKEIELTPGMEIDFAGKLKVYILEAPQTTSSSQPTQFLEAEEPPYFKIISGPGAGSVIEIFSSGILGREEGIEYQVQDPHTSRKHLMIYFLGDTVEVENLSQTNPTVLNGKILKERTRLKSGDILKVGRMTLLFVNPSEKPETELMVRKPNTALIVGISAVLLLLIAGTTTFLYLNQRKNEAQSSLSLAISTFATAENEQDPEKILKNYSLVKDYAQKALNLDKSLSQAKEFVSKADSLLNAWRNVVDALKLVKEGKFDEAMENLDRVRPILGDRLIFNQIYAPLANRLSAIQNVELAKALIQKGDYKRALLLIESALEGDPENEQLLALKGTVENLMSSQRPVKAEVVRRIFEKKVEEVKVKREEEKKAEGLGTATTSIQIQQTPKLSSEISVNLPKVEVSLGEVKPTINLNTGTLDKRTQMIEAYKRGDLTTTLRLATEILSENPQDYTAKRYQQLAQLENKAISYEKAGDKQKALEIWQMVLNYDKGNQRALNAISRLKQ
ncbi:FHA domain-containing protein [Candidatus Caldipriscus sp.]|nr:FHA domain-containing protein [Candidatus Caldipriscus sp.]